MRFRLNFDPVLTADLDALANGTLTFFVSGTEDLATIWRDHNLSVFGTNPVPLDASGRHGDIFLLDNFAYRVVVKDAQGAIVPGGDVDPIADDLSNLVLHGGPGESLTLTTVGGEYRLMAQKTGGGAYLPIVIGTGERVAGEAMRQIVCHPDGYLTLGGDYGHSAMLVAPVGGTQPSNFLFVAGSEKDSVSGGNVVLLAARSSTGGAPDVYMAFSTLGDGQFQFLSHTYNAVEFRILPGGQPDHLTLSSGNGVTPLSAEGASTNIDIQLLCKGAGMPWLGYWTGSGDTAINGYIQVKDQFGNVRKLATIP